MTAAKWQDVNLAANTWTLQATKNGTQHVIPLSRQAGALLRGLQPAQADPEGLVFSNSGGGALSAWDEATDTIQAASSTEGWQRHDLRRTAATLMGEMGVAAHVIESALNHADVHSPLASVYNRSRVWCRSCRRVAAAGGCIGRDRTRRGRGDPATRLSEPGDFFFTSL